MMGKFSTTPVEECALRVNNALRTLENHAERIASDNEMFFRKWYDVATLERWIVACGEICTLRDEIRKETDNTNSYHFDLLPLYEKFNVIREKYWDLRKQAMGKQSDFFRCCFVTESDKRIKDSVAIISKELSTDVDTDKENAKFNEDIFELRKEIVQARLEYRGMLRKMDRCLDDILMCCRNLFADMRITYLDALVNTNMKDLENADKSYFSAYYDYLFGNSIFKRKASQTYRKEKQLHGFDSCSLHDIQQQQIVEMILSGLFNEELKKVTRRETMNCKLKLDESAFPAGQIPDNLQEIQVVAERILECNGTRYAPRMDEVGRRLYKMRNKTDEEVLKNLEQFMTACWIVGRISWYNAQEDEDDEQTSTALQKEDNVKGSGKPISIQNPLGKYKEKIRSLFFSENPILNYMEMSQLTLLFLSLLGKKAIVKDCETTKFVKYVAEIVPELYEMEKNSKNKNQKPGKRTKDDYAKSINTKLNNVRSLVYEINDQADVKKVIKEMYASQPTTAENMARKIDNIFETMK